MRHSLLLSCYIISPARHWMKCEPFFHTSYVIPQTWRQGFGLLGGGTGHYTSFYLINCQKYYCQFFEGFPQNLERGGLLQPGRNGEVSEDTGPPHGLSQPPQNGQLTGECWTSAVQYSCYSCYWSAVALEHSNYLVSASLSSRPDSQYPRACRGNGLRTLRSLVKAHE